MNQYKCVVLVAIVIIIIIIGIIIIGDILFYTIFTCFFPVPQRQFPRMSTALLSNESNSMKT